MTHGRRGLLGMRAIAGLGAGTLLFALPAGAAVSRVSVGPGGTQIAGDSVEQTLSADGRVVAFVTRAPGVVSGCGGWLYLHDRGAGQTVACLPATGGDPPGPALSADGRVVAYRNTVGGGATPPVIHTFAHDRATGATEMVSVTDDGTPANTQSAHRDTTTWPAVSADGGVVAFGASATNLAPGVSGLQIYLRDRSAGRTTWISRGSGGTPLGATAFNGGPALSADGRIVAWGSAARQVFVHDRTTGQTMQVSVASDGTPAGVTGPSGWPAVSADGRVVAFVSVAANLVPGDTNGVADVFVHDRLTRTTTRVNVASDGTQANGGSCTSTLPCRPALSADGRFVAFESAGTNLVPGAPGDGVFVHDRLTRQTRRIAAGWAPGISGDGGVVSFVSSAADLVAGDTNQAADVFVATLAAGPPPPPGLLVTGSGPGSGPRVQILSATAGTAASALSWMAYDAAFQGGVYVAVGNVDGVGEPEVVTAAGPGGGPHVRVLRADGSDGGPGFFAYASAFTGGVRVATCDVDGDGRAEIVTGPGPGGGPHVRVWRVMGSGVQELAGFLAYAPAFTGGVSVGCGDVDGDGRGDVVTGADAGGGAHVRVFAVGGGTVRELAGYLAYAPGFTGGVRVAAGDVDGDGSAEIVTGPGPGGGPHVRLWRVTGGGVQEVAGVMAYAPTFTGGVYVGCGDVDGDGRAEVVTGADAGGGPHVRVFDAALREVGSFFAYEASFTGGVRVAAGGR